MKSQLQLSLVAFVLFCFSCASDESVPNNELAGANGFQFENQAYSTESIYLSQDNTITMTNQLISVNGTSSDIDFVQFTFTESELSQQSYFAGEELASCLTLTQAIWDQGAVSEGEVILDDGIIASGFFRILNLDRAEEKIEIIFEFERTDGELVAGSYKGSYRLADF